MVPLSVVIVSYNTKALLISCLESLRVSLSHAGISKTAEVIVVDNASTDGSTKAVHTQFPDIFLIKNSTNTGFSRANNQGIQKAKGAAVLFLNSDTRVTKTAIAELLTALGSDATIGVVGPKLLNEDDTVQPSAGFLPSIGRIASWMLFLDDIPGMRVFLTPYHVEADSFYSAPHDVGWVTGACMLVTRQVINATGGFEEAIFMYGEEVEWCYRIKKDRFRVVYTPDAVVYHLKGGSSGEGSDAGITEEFRTLLVFFRRHKPAWQYPIVKMLLITGAWLRVKLFGIMGKYVGRQHIYAKTLEVVGRL